MARHNGLSFYKRKKKINIAVVKEILSWLFGIVVSVFLAVVVNYFYGMNTAVVGASMEPALYGGQQILIDGFLYMLASPDTGDVVLFLPNGNENSHYYTKRIVAGPGDSVLIEDGILYVNGQRSGLISEKIMDAGIAANEITLKSGEYFCMGDNPNNSEDSRSANIGPVKEENIIGRAWFRFKKEDSGIGLIK